MNPRLTFVIAFVACLICAVRAEAPLPELALDLKPPVGPIDYTYANYQNYGQESSEKPNPPPEEEPSKVEDVEIVETAKPSPKPDEVKVPVEQPVINEIPLQSQFYYRIYNPEAHSVYYQTPGLTFHRVDNFQRPLGTIHKPEVIYGPPPTTTTTTTTTRKPKPTYIPPTTSRPTTTKPPKPTYIPPTTRPTTTKPPRPTYVPPKNPSPGNGKPSVPSKTLVPPEGDSQDSVPSQTTPASRPTPAKPTYIPPHRPSTTTTTTTPRPVYGPPKWTTTTTTHRPWTPPSTTPYIKYGPPNKTTPSSKYIPPSTTPYREYGPPIRTTTTTKKPWKGYVYTTPAPEVPKITYGPPALDSKPSYRLDPKRLRLSTVLGALSKLAASLQQAEDPYTTEQ